MGHEETRWIALAKWLGRAMQSGKLPKKVGTVFVVSITKGKSQRWAWSNRVGVRHDAKKKPPGGTGGGG